MFDLDRYIKLVNENSDLAREYCLQFDDEIIAKCALECLDLVNLTLRNPQDIVLSIKDSLPLLSKKAQEYFVEVILKYFYTRFDYHNLYRFSQQFIKIVSNDEIQLYYNLARAKLFNEENAYIEIRNYAQSHKNIVSSELILLVSHYYYERAQLNEVDEFFNVLKKNEIIPLDVLCSIEFNLACFHLDSEERLNLFFYNWLDAYDDKENFYQQIYNNMYEVTIINPDLVIKWFKELKKFVKKEENIKKYNLYLAVIYTLADKTKEANEIFKLVDNKLFDNMYFELYCKALSIYSCLDKDRYDEAIECLEICLKNSDNRTYYELLIDLYYREGKYDKSLRYINLLKIKHNIENNYMSALNFLRMGDFDNAYKQIKKDCKVKGKIDVLYNCLVEKYDAYSNKIFKQALKGNQQDDYRYLAMMYFHGFGVKEINIDKALESAKKAYELDNNVLNSANLGIIYLNMKEYEKAYNLFYEGYLKYVNHEDDSLIGLGLYCYCLSFGYGVDKDENLAYTILDNQSYINSDSCSLYTYAYLSLIRGENLNKVYKLLVNHYQCRYEVGKYFLLIKIANKLGINSSRYEKYFYHNLEYAPIREKMHYQNNPEIFYLNNI